MLEASRPLQNAPFCPISALGSNFHPQNTQCIPVVQIFACLELEQNWAFFKGLDSYNGRQTTDSNISIPRERINETITF